MAVEIEKLFSNNWFIYQETTNRLCLQAQLDWYKQQKRVYLGDTRSLNPIIAAFSDKCNGASDNSCQIFVRKSCLNSQTDQWLPPGKYQPIEIYLSHRSGDERTVYEATWTPKRRVRDNDLLRILESKFKPLLERKVFNGSKLKFTEGFENCK